MVAAAVGDLVVPLGLALGLEEGLVLAEVVDGETGDCPVVCAGLRGVAGVAFGVLAGVGVVVCAVLQLQAPHVIRQ